MSENCPVCGRGASTADIPDKVDLKVRCTHCGEYIISSELIEMFSLPSDSNDNYKLHMERYLYESKNKGLRTILVERREPSLPDEGIVIDLDGIKEEYKKEPSPLEKLDITVLRMAEATGKLGRQFNLVDDKWIVPTLDNDERKMTLRFLADKGLIESNNQNMDKFWLKPEGFQYVHELKTRRPYSNKVFIAASFTDELKEMRERLVMTVESLGYEPFIVNLLPHNDIIDLKIYDGIRSCTFMVADLTFNRQSVYYEIGFAHGLGLQVILTCRNDCFKDNDDPAKRVHFDLEHRNILLWGDVDELEKKLKMHILQGFGKWTG